jgi:hypothetical protein
LTANYPGTATSNGHTNGSTASFAVGDIVEYYSVSQNGWIPAKVLAITPSGTYNLDCKPDVPADKLRRPNSGPPINEIPRPLHQTQPAGGATATYAVGDSLEYYSVSKGGWIPCRVTDNTTGFV